MGLLRSADVQKLLHNKFVVILGDSIQRSVYKDLVKLLRGDKFLSEAQLKRRGELKFENDALIEGGELTGMHNETTFQEVRQYRTGHHLVRFYFLTRAYSTYLESILSDFRSGPQPDVLIVNSCIWDLSRYNDHNQEAYKTNLDLLFQRLKEVLSLKCLILWTMTMPVGYKPHEIQEYTTYNLRADIVDGNFFSATLADFHKLDVVDMHYHFRYNLSHRSRDSIHWNQVVHRKYTQILLAHIAEAWGVEVPKSEGSEGSAASSVSPPLGVGQKTPYPRPRPVIPGAAYMPGYTAFDGAENGAITGSVAPKAPLLPRPDPYPRPHLPIQERSMAADSPFVSDSPLLTPNIPPGYFTAPGPPCSGRNVPLLEVPPHVLFTPFTHYTPYQQESWNMKMTSRRVPKPRRGWGDPYSRPPHYPPRIY